eukprot:TRINITY_DN42001_c0_g1_i1.p1 TRINITY_DN42001_c0_g1~~TRINITY_DN42001_c0_g1_i1.p1  ORF type:complete len:101 (-),score=1.70 TRINITY_DN42001_c0_g1_i1:161-463(-)
MRRLKTTNSTLQTPEIKLPRTKLNQGTSQLSASQVFFSRNCLKHNDETKLISRTFVTLKMRLRDAYLDKMEKESTIASTKVSKVQYDEVCRKFEQERRER